METTMTHEYPKGSSLEDVWAVLKNMAEQHAEWKKENDLQRKETDLQKEVKTKPKKQDIEHHIKRLEILRQQRNKNNDTRKIYGTIAGAVFGKEEKEACIEAGFYVIEQTGDTMKIEMPEGFIPKGW